MNNDRAAFIVFTLVIVGVGLSFLWRSEWPALVAFFVLGGFIWFTTGGKYQ